MKCASLTVAILFYMAGSVPVLAEAQAVSDTTSDAVVSEPASPTPASSSTSRPMHNMGMMHMGKGQHGNPQGQGGMMHGGGKHGKGQGAMMHGGGKHGKDMQQKHEQVVQRLDMIEARMAKIEAMLEILVRR